MALVAHYDFGNSSSYPGSGTTVYDLTAGNNDLTFTSAPTYSSALGGHVVLNNTMSANLSGTYPNNLPSGQDDFTMVIWAQAVSSYNVAMFALGGGNPAGARVDMGYGFSSSILGSEFYSSYIQQSTTPTVGTWFQYVITGVAGNTSVQLLTYVNGKLDSKTAGATVPTIDFNNNDTFPNNNPRLSINWQGAAGDMKIIKAEVWDTVLTANQIKDDYIDFLKRTKDLVSEYNANESSSYPGSGTQWTDLSPSSKNITLYSPAFTAATVTTPAYFSFPARNFGDPLTVYGEYNGTPAITTQSSWTGYFWVRRNVIHSSYTQNRLSIFANGREDLIGGDNGWSYGTYNNPNAANDNVVIEAAGVGVKDSGYGMGEDCWVNLAYIYSGGNISIYENGQLLSTQSFSYTTPADGMWLSRTAGSYFSWIGDISIIRQFGAALTGTELLNLIQYDRDNYIPNPTVIASWDASDSASYSGSGNTWYDLTGNNVDLIGAGSFTYTAKNTTPNPLGWTNPGYFSNAATNRMVSIASNYLRFSTTGTIQGWFYNNNSYGVPLSFPYNGNFPSYWYQVYANKPGFNFLVDNTFRNWDPGGSVINLQWFNWAIVFNNGNADLYINGVYQSTNSQSAFGSGIFYNPANLNLVIGDIDNSGANYPFVGRLGEIKIYSTALSAGDILQNYNDTLYKYDGNVAPPGPGPSPYVGLVGGRTFGQGFAG